VIVEINGKPIRDMRDALIQVAATRPGAEIRMEIVRDGDREELTATAAERPVARRRER
jgi:serine protease DegS